MTTTNPTRTALETSVAGTDQVLDAMGRLNIDPTTLPRLPWDSVHDVVGPIWPTDIWCLAAATGNGKTTALAHLIESWVGLRIPVYVLSLEQDPMEIRTALAALATGLHTQRVLENDWRHLPTGAKQRIADHLKWQDSADVRTILRFGHHTSVAVDELDQVLYGAHELGAKLVILDHIGMIDLGDGNQYGALRRVCRTLKAFTNACRVPIIMAAQLNRGERDPIQPYQPPNPYGIEGGEIVRQIASVALGLYRPLGSEFGAEDARQVRQGKRKIGEFVKPHTLGMHLMKHRLRGHLLGELLELDYRDGRIICPRTASRVAQEDRYDI